MLAPSLRAASCLLVAGLTMACGARTTLSVGEDAGTRDAGHDAGRRDAGPSDAGRPDAGRPDAGPPPSDCARDADCTGSEVCRAALRFTALDLTSLPLTCAEPTAGASAVTAPCRLRSECDRGICALAGACVMPCLTDADCGDGDVCRQVYVTTSASAMQTVDACVAEVAAAEGVEVTVGPGVAASLDEVRFEPVSLEEHTLVIYEGAPDTVPFLAQINAPDGAVVFEPGSTGSEPAWGLNPVALSSYVTALYPNGPRSPAQGVYELGLSALLDSTATRRTVARRAGEGEVLDVDVYLVGGNRWRSPDGAFPTGLDITIGDARAIFDTVGVRVGEVRIHEVVGGLRTRLSVLRGAVPPFDAPAGLTELFELTAGARRPGVHVFLVREIDGALGIAAGIPGVQVLPGTGASGVAISADLIPIDELGLVLVHEVGHYLGLFHSTENDGSISDPYEDTPSCPTSLDTNGDGFVDPVECAGSGAENVMFWAGQGTDISPQQGRVLTGSPLLGR